MCEGNLGGGGLEVWVQRVVCLQGGGRSPRSAGLEELVSDLLMVGVGVVASLGIVYQVGGGCRGVSG